MVRCLRAPRLASPSPLVVAATALAVLAVIAGAPMAAYGQVPSVRIIQTVAGTGVGGFSGDGGPATAARLSHPGESAIDSQGNLYIADTYNNRIRRIDHATGLISTVAGTGVYGSGGDGGPATAAEMGNVMSMAFDAADNLYIGEGVTYTIRRIDAVTGLVTRVAGSGTYGYSGDDGPATQAEIAAPWGIAVDAAGNLYIAAGENYRVRKVNLATGIITTAAGNGSWLYGGDGSVAATSGLGYPYDVAVDAAGNLYIAVDQQYVRRVDAASGIITTVAGSGVYGDAGDGGQATAASFKSLMSVSLDALGNVYVTDGSAYRVRAFDLATGLISTVAGTGVYGYGEASGDGGPATMAPLSNPWAVLADRAGNLVFGDENRVRHVSSAVAPRFTAEGDDATVWAGDPASFTVAFTGVPQPAVVWQLSSDQGATFADLTDSSPYSGATTPALSISAAPFTFNGYVYRARITNTWGEAWSTPRSLTVTKRVPVITWANPAPILPGTALDATQLNATASVPGTFAYTPPAGTVMVAGSDQVLRADFTPTDSAAYASVSASVLISVIGAAGEGARYINTVAGRGVYGPGGDGGLATDAQFADPMNTYVDTAGNLYIADANNHRIRMVSAATGIISTFAGTGTAGYNGDGLAATATQLYRPTDIRADGDGNLYIADHGNSRVRKIDAATGLVSTVAGTGVAGISGDGGPATAAQMQTPRALAFDPAGNLYIADSDASQIRKVAAGTGIISTVVTGTTVHGLRCDPAGNLYYSDYYPGSRVRVLSATTGLVTTVAGNGTYGSAGDGGPATAAELNYPMGIDLDSDGNIYVVEYWGHRARRIAKATGTISTVAGTGVWGFSGDGGLATAAQFRTPTGLTVVGKDFYLADSGNYRIMRVAEGAAPAFAAQPVNKSTDVGGSAVFSVGVSGFPVPTYLWYVSTDGALWFGLADSAPYSGVHTRALTITGATLGMDGNQYRVVATNIMGTATSNAATLTVATVVKETPVITWAAPAAITYGTLLSDTQLNATANVAGSFAYTPAAGTKLSGGSHTLSVLFTPDNGASYTTATAEVTLQVNRAPTIITWPDPVGVVYGTALSAAQLNATANVPGSFLYSPAAGTVLNAGTHFLSVFFTPTAAGDYAPSSAAASITVSQATPVVTWAAPAPIVFGTPLGAAQLNATANTAGSLTYSSPPGTVLPAGVHSVTATFTPTDVVNYASATASTMIVVLQATPTITWATPAPITHLTPLGAAQLNATADVPGTFDYYPPAGTVLGLGSGQELRAYFTPTDTLNFASVNKAITIDVIPFGPIITTFAGTGTAGFGGDGGAATAALIQGPYGLAIDPAGTLFIADSYNYRVRKVAAGTGVMTTVAGSGAVHPDSPIGGYGGDGGPATAALFRFVADVAVDAAGNLYIGDTSNHRVRKVNAATGVVTTVAGTGVYDSSGDNQPAAAVPLGNPDGVALDAAGNLYIADPYDSRIRKVTAATGLITTVAGTAVPGYSGDGGLATQARLNRANDAVVDAAGNVYIADTNNNRIRMVSAATGIITTVAGTGVADFSGDDGPATAATIHTPTRLALDGAGNVYFSDAGNSRIRKINTATGIISTVAGNGDWHGGAAGDGEEAVLAQIGVVHGIAIDAAGNLYLSGSDTHRIRKVSQLGAPTFWLTFAPAPVHGVVAGGGISCGTGATVCQAGFASATTVTLTATPDTDYLFQGWGGACAGTDPSTTVDVGASTTCTATFVPAAPPDGPPYTFTVTAPTGGTVQGAGINCGAGGTACAITMPAAMTLGIAATASSGYTFTGWTGDCTGSTASIWVALNGPRTCGATFTPIGGGGGLPSGPPYTLTIALPAGGKVSGAGINCGAGGTACTVTMPAAMTLGIGAVASAGYTFAGWTGDCTGTIADIWVALNGPRTCGATFTPAGGGGGTYPLTIAPAPTGGTVTGNGLTCGAGGATCAVTLASGTVASLTAVPASGYVFSSWGGACSGTNATTTVLLDAARTCSATFAASGGGPVNGPPYTLTVTAPTGGTIQGAGINCGVGGAACSVTMPAAMTLGISATPSAGYTFTAWTGDCTGTSPSQWVALNGPRTCGATFTATGGGGGGGLPSGPPYTLTITMPTGGTVQGAGINCGAGGTACSVTMPASMTLGISATPSAGYTFTGWTGDCAGTTPSLWVALNGPRTCGATFAPSGGAGH